MAPPSGPRPIAKGSQITACISRISPSCSGARCDAARGSCGRRMSAGTLLVLSASEVAEMVRGEEPLLMDLVAEAYRTHGRGESAVPHSSFLRLPSSGDRMIALPAYLGGEF